MNYEPAPRTPALRCALAHDVTNKLSVIIGQCDLLSSHPDLQPECAKRLAIIRETAQAMATRMNGDECRANETAPPTVVGSAYSAPILKVH